MQQHTMVQAIIVNVSTKIHLDGPLISETKLIMTPSIDTEQNMTISIQMRIEIVEIVKFGTLTVRIDKLYSTSFHTHPNSCATTHNPNPQATSYYHTLKYQDHHRSNAMIV